MLIHKLQMKKDLSPSEQVLADFVLNNMQKVCGMNTREISIEAFASPATVIRFSKKMGFDSFEKFKQQLFAEWSRNNGNIDSIDADFPFEYDTPYVKIFERMTDLETKAIRETKELIQLEKWEKIISDISKFKIIDIYGEGISFTVASNFKTNMERIGYDVFMDGDRSSQTRKCIGLYPDHFSLLLSYSGETEFTVSVARLLHQNKRTSLSITSEKDNTLKQYTTHNLSIARMEGKITSGGISNMCSNMSFSYILDLIYACVFQKDYDKNRQLMHEKVLLQQLFFDPKNKN